MSWQTEWKSLLGLVLGFLACFYLPVENTQFNHAVIEALRLVNWYAQTHVLLCLLPAFFIAGAIATFVSQTAVMKYVGPKANIALAYPVAATSGGVLSICSCTILPLFAGIYRMGAGLGPACTFLFSGPAINVLAAMMTTRILGLELGIARAIGAIGLSIVIGLLMAFIFRKEEQKKRTILQAPPEEPPKRSLGKNILFFAAMFGVLLFANFGCSCSYTGVAGVERIIYRNMWVLASLCGILLGVILVLWFGMKWWKAGAVAVGVAVSAYLFPDNVLIPFVAALLGLSFMTSTDKGECGGWFAASWLSAKQTLPLLLIGVMLAGLLLGSGNGKEGLIPPDWIAWMLGGNTLGANVFASCAGALMYFATLTEVPLVQGLLDAGMGRGPALALLLAGPSLSLPSMLVINSVLGLKKTFVFVGLVVVFSAVLGLVFGCFFP